MPFFNHGFVEELSQSMRLSLMLSDTAVSQRNALKELSRLVKLGILPCEASEGPGTV